MITRWQNNRLRRGLVFSALYALLAVSHVLPPDFRYLSWELRARALSRVVHGFAEFVVFVGQIVIGAPSPVHTLIGLSIAGPLVWFLLTRLWDHPGEGREIAIFLTAANLAFGAVAVYAGSLLVGEPFRDCPLRREDSPSLEILIYPEIGWLPDRHLFLLSSTDAGVTWSQVMHVGPISQSSGCGPVRSLDEHFLWYWIGWKLAITHDGGDTWTVWNPSDLIPGWRCCDPNLIADVQFADESSGVMRGSFGFVGTDHLVSDDGGATWAVP